MFKLYLTFDTLLNSGSQCVLIFSGFSFTPFPLSTYNLVYICWVCSLVSNFTISAWSARVLSWPGLGYTTGMTALISFAFLRCEQSAIGCESVMCFSESLWLCAHLHIIQYSVHIFTHRVGVWCGFYHLLSNTDDSFHITAYTTLFYIKIKVWLMIL